jgi:ubiquinone/menaquinone biosynthesis C-methylase UbiE
MYRIAPYVHRYIGTDLSDVTLEINRERNKQDCIENISLISASANEIIDKVPDRNIDIVIINSVIQYFDSVSYLEDVIVKASNMLNNKGIIYIGDVRDASKKELFMERNSRKKYKMNELFFEREYFLSLKDKFDFIDKVEVSDKIGLIDNELKMYRYDVIIYT